MKVFYRYRFSYISIIIILFTIVIIMQKYTKSFTSSTNSNSVIVIGSGLAGLSAASSLISHGIKVTLLEMESKLGGNSIKASSGINGAPTKYQPNYNQLQDIYFNEDTIKSAGLKFQSSSKDLQNYRLNLIQTLTSNSADAIDWLTSNFNIDLSIVSRLGGHSFPRTHRGSGKLPPGAAIINGLSSYIKQNQFKDLIEIKTDSIVTKILLNDDNKQIIKGIEYYNKLTKSTFILNGPVIIAVGGFAGDKDGLLSEFRPDLKNYPSTNSPRKNSLNLLIDIGAQLIDIDQIQIHPTGFIDPLDEFSPIKFLAAEALRGEGGILLDQFGNRFVNEVLQRDQVTHEIQNHIPKSSNNEIDQWESYILLDESSAKSMQNNIDFYCFKKLMSKTTIGELINKLPNLEKTLIDYSSIVSNSKNDPLGRTHFGHWSLEPNQITSDTAIYIGRITPVTHFTMGGVKFNSKSQILNNDNKPFENIWAAGEVTGGLHGSNRLGGSSLLECVVFGRIAANQLVNNYKI